VCAGCRGDELYFTRTHFVLERGGGRDLRARPRARAAGEKEEWSGDYFDAMHHGEHRCTGLDRWFLQLAA
jgi:hypothetical protein